MKYLNKFEEWYFGNVKGTYYKYSKEILENEDQIKEIRESDEYASMQMAWNAGFNFGFKEGANKEAHEEEEYRWYFGK